MKKRLMALLLSMVMTVTLLSGCGGTEAETNTETSGETSGSQEDRTLIVGNSGDFVSCDPHNCSGAVTKFILNANVYERLTLAGADGVQPCLAYDWEANEDATEWTFYLEEGVKFHNGDIMTANDVKFSYERGAESAYASYITSVESVEVIDEYTVKFYLKHPYSAFPSIATVTEIMSEEWVNEVGEDQVAMQSCGTGPYKIADWVTGEKVVLEKNDEYWGETKPSIQTIEVRTITDASTRAASLQSGDIDLTVALSASDMESIRNDERFTVLEGQEIYCKTMYLNLSNQYLSDVRVRQAIAMAINRDEIAYVATEGLGEAALMPLHDSYGYPKVAEETVFTQDVERAKELLAEAGYPDGFTIKLNANEGAYRLAAEAIQAQLAEIGITVEIQTMDWATVVSNLRSGNFEMSMENLSDVFFYNVHPIIETRFVEGGSSNFTGYNNPRVNELMNLAEASLDEEEQAGYYEEIFEILNEDVPFIPLFWNYNNNVFTKDLEGVEYSSANILSFAKMKWVVN